MEFTLLEIEIHKHAQSWINILLIKNWHLFYIEWTYEREIIDLRIFNIEIIK